MLTRRFALIIGIVYLAVGVIGFIPGLSNAAPQEAPSMHVNFDYNYLAGLFPINVLHNIVHLLIGVAGIAMSRQFLSARLFSRGLAVLYGLLAVMGTIPGLNTVFGLIPIFDGDVILHALTALLAAYFGWFAPDTRHAMSEDVSARPIRRAG